MKIVVLCGGTSTERAVSISSGYNVCKALRSKGHRACLTDVYTGHPGVSDLEALFVTDGDLKKDARALWELAPNGADALRLSRTGNDGFFGANVLKLCRMADVVFLALHGANGEDGKIQAAFQLLDIPYTGAPSFGSALAMNKGVTKDIFIAHGVPTPKGIAIHKNKNKKDLASLGLTLPVVVKPCCGGSSVGVYIAHTEEEYLDALTKAFSYEDELVVEQYIRGREFSVGLLEGKALPVIEIAPKEGFYNYENKYTAGAAVDTCPAALSPQLTEQMQQYAERAYKVLHLEAYARFDFLLDEQDNMFCLEANTLPGMTATSLLPQEAAVIGMDYPALCEHIVSISLNR